MPYLLVVDCLLQFIVENVASIGYPKSRLKWCTNAIPSSSIIQNLLNILLPLLDVLNIFLDLGGIKITDMAPTLMTFVRIRLRHQQSNNLCMRFDELETRPQWHMPECNKIGGHPIKINITTCDKQNYSKELDLIQDIISRKCGWLNVLEVYSMCPPQSPWAQLFLGVPVSKLQNLCSSMKWKSTCLKTKTNK